MTIRLNKVTRDLNVGITTVVEFLQKKGFADIEVNPNTKITEEQYALLVKIRICGSNLKNLFRNVKIKIVIKLQFQLMALKKCRQRQKKKKRL